MNKAGKLRELYDSAYHSIALPIMPNSLALETYRLQLSRYQGLNRERKQLQERAQYVVLQTIPGIGPINALQFWQKPGICVAFPITANFSNTAALIWRRISPVLPGAKSKSRNGECPFTLGLLDGRAGRGTSAGKFVSSQI